MPRQPLIIRRAQLHALGETVLAEFMLRLADHIAAVFPGHAEFIQSPQGRAFVRRGVDQARRLRLRDEHSIALFVDLRVALGADFLQQARFGWINEIIEDMGQSDTARLFLIYAQLPQRCPQPALPPPAFDAVDAAEEMAAPPLRRPALVKQWPAGFWG